MSSSVTSSPARFGSLHGKSGAALSQCKSLMSDQHNRLVNKHNTDIELMDDVRTYLKAKFNIERDYALAMIKLSANHAKKFPQFSGENDTEFKTLYTSWKLYVEESDRCSKNRLSQYEQFLTICDSLKQMRAHKVQIGKKHIDQHLKKMHEEILTSVSEIEKTRKLYFEEEHLAKQARDKEEKIKKRKGGIFASFANLQTKKEKTSAFREASDIQSTQARNDYLMALAAGNAHFNRFHSTDLPVLMQTVEDNVLDKCRGFILTLLESEMNTLTVCTESINKSTVLVESSSSDHTNNIYLSEPQSASIRETLFFEFDACDGDSLTTVCGDHNADIALKNEVQKWGSWFTKECRNFSRLGQQLTRCQALLLEGHKTVEVTGMGQVDIEARIDDIKQQIRRCEISKIKAQARLMAIKESGIEMEDYDDVEVQVTTEMKQTSLDVYDIGQPLSRTPSLRSANISTLSDGGRLSSLDGKFSDDTDKDQTPEPDLSGRVSAYGRESSSSEHLESPTDKQNTYEIQQNSYQQYDAQQYSWSEDPATAWGDDEVIQQPIPEVNENEHGDEYSEYAAVDGTQIIGKICNALYSYNSQTQEELSFVENETLIIIEGCDRDWVKAQNDRFMVGYVPAAYLQVIGDAPPDSMPNYQESDTTIMTQENLSNDSHLGYVKAIYDYTASSKEEISFCEGDLIKLITKSEDGWWIGEKDGVQGHFPSMLVEDPNDKDEDANDEAAFEDSGSDEDSGESINLPALPCAPPPSFAPPKPIHLTPHSVNIIQPTPEVESRAPLGEEEENDRNDTVSDIKINTECDETMDETTPNVVVMNPDFTLDRPTKKSSSDEESENDMDTKEKRDDDGDAEFRSSSGINMHGIEAIEATAEEISETITNEAIYDAAKEAMDISAKERYDQYESNECTDENVNENVNENGYGNANHDDDDEYEDLK